MPTGSVATRRKDASGTRTATGSLGTNARLCELVMKLPTIKEANEALAHAQRMNRLRREAEGEAYQQWLDERMGIRRP
jgi:hypothetical protein